MWGSNRRVSTNGRRRFIDDRPKHTQIAHRVDEGVEIHRLDDISVAPSS
jgi:hypothetical protein